MKPPSWLTTLVLAALLVTLYMNWSWPWGVLFIYWALPSYISGEAFLIGPIAREESPILFWVVTVLWLMLGVVMILIDAAPTVIQDVYAFLWRP